MMAKFVIRFLSISRLRLGAPHVVTKGGTALSSVMGSALQRTLRKI